ncbi:TSUP family transporter [Rothia uropygialis]|uniref:TSUP family transporter n=1 Tax=Kocuria sp. 36 TaxID=1415402 RepID=UPI00101D6B0E|nr:TSUP family transporter [Kocuria sp. 36]
MIAGIESLDPGTLVLVLVGGFLAGWVDAVVGGGGLIQLPVVLMIPGMTPVQALATNKFGSLLGTSTSAVTYFRRTTTPLRPSLPMAGVAFFGSFAGAAVAASLPQAVFKPVILAALIAVAVFTVLKPNAGTLTKPTMDSRSVLVRSTVLGLVIGFYDGVLGPGTGSFLIIGLITLLGQNFLRASAQAKVVNMATNLGALAFFGFHGSVVWALGLLLGIANMVGGYTGARSAVSRGNRFIRVVFLAVVAVLIVKTGWDIYADAIA